MLTQAEQDYFVQQQALHEAKYLAGSTPQQQSGFGRDARDWERFRRPVVAPLTRNGSFLDVGCANGLLMESVDAWARADGLGVEVFGLDISEKLAELARQRLPHWRNRIFVGNALFWEPPARFDYVRTELVYVPPPRRREYTERLLARFLVPGGKLLICSYGSSRPEGARAETLMTFQPRHEIPVAVGPVSIAVRDLDGDELEIVYASPSFMVATDLDGNGITDLVVSTAGRYLLSVFKGLTGGFAPRQDIQMAGCPYGFAIADVTRDGLPDIIAAQPCDSTVAILEGEGNGRFTLSATCAVPTGPEAVAVGDLNRDGRLDLVVACRRSNSVSVFLQDFGGRYSSRRDFDAGEAPSSVVIADITEDGIPDAMVSNLSRTRGASLLRGAGNGSFLPAVPIGGGRFAESVTVGDLNADGHLDIVVPILPDNAVSIAMGLGGGEFSEEAALGVGFHPSSAAIGDLDLDQLPDLVVANEISQDISLLRNRGPRGPVPRPSVLIGNRPNPFNPGTTITYFLARPGLVVVRVFDTSGGLARTVQREYRASGDQTAYWDGRLDSGAPAPSGIYFCRITFPDGEGQSSKMALVR